MPEFTLSVVDQSPMRMGGTAAEASKRAWRLQKPWRSSATNATG